MRSSSMPGMLIWPRNVPATASSASGGHSWNQSIVQQLMSDGNWRRRVRSPSPTGLMQSTMCRLHLTRSTK